MQKDLQTIRRFFEKDKFVALSGIEIESVTEEEAVVSAKINENHLNANGCVQGGMLYTLADFAYDIALNSNATTLYSLNYDTHRLQGIVVFGKEFPKIVISRNGSNNLH